MILKHLLALNVWLTGPGVGGDCGPYRQSERNSLYKHYADKLVESVHVYRCFCSNEEVEKMKEIAKLKQLPPMYTGKWANATNEEVQQELDKGTPYTYRFRVPKEGSLKINDPIRGEVDERSASKSTTIRKVGTLIGEHWKSAGILIQSEGPFVEYEVQLFKDGIDLITDSEKALSNLLSCPLHATLKSPEGKTVVDDKHSEVSSRLLDAYDSGELVGVLEGGLSGWQKWVKDFWQITEAQGKAAFNISK